MTTSQSLAWLIAAPHAYGSEVRDGQSELADDHLPGRVADERELVVLLADARAHRGAEQHGVHLVPGVAEGVLDDVDGDRVDVDPAERGGRGLDEGGHGYAPALAGRMRIEPTESTVPA
jgi:hypothetical protein